MGREDDPLAHREVSAAFSEAVLDSQGLTGRARITQNRMDAKAIEETMVGLEKVPEELFNPETGGSIPPILPLVIMAGAGAVMLYLHKREKVSFVCNMGPTEFPLAPCCCFANAVGRTISERAKRINFARNALWTGG